MVSAKLHLKIAPCGIGNECINFIYEHAHSQLSAISRYQESVSGSPRGTATAAQHSYNIDVDQLRKKKRCLVNPFRKSGLSKIMAVADTYIQLMLCWIPALRLLFLDFTPVPSGDPTLLLFYQNSVF